jgi:asparagine synthase (glutamine-hydrolysing)
MCGITGLMAFNEIGRINLIQLEKATRSLEKRGPDHQDTYFDEFVGLGHRRLSILDTSDLARQPMTDKSGRYILTYNGEIYNFKALRQELEQKGVAFQSSGDTEVLLQALIHWGKATLPKLNGFFAFAFYDKAEQSLLVVRDKVGIKPLLYFQDDNKFIFASEMKAMLAYNIEREISPEAFYSYFQLNYTPAPFTMVAGVMKLMPGEYIEVKKGSLDKKAYYELPVPNVQISDYATASTQLLNLLDEAVALRMISDVPIGTFLSGGIDSSIITAIASKHTDQLNTFSVGFKDQPYFDESAYALKVANKFKTNHHQFSLTTNDMLGAVQDIVAAIDEPFADSSAIPVYILSRETRKKVTVALSGDGADELFGGYNKHAAWLRSINGGFASSIATSLAPLWASMPQSRSDKLGNLIRQLYRFSSGAKLSPKDRYWYWASITNANVLETWLQKPDEEMLKSTLIKDLYLEQMEQGDMNQFLYTDMKLVLPNDMLTKVDLMSMANSLEVRVPFLDYRVVDFASKLHSDLKITPKIRKRILQESFRAVLPKELYKRPKKGFEVPLLAWFKTDLKHVLDEIVFNPDYLESQGIFRPSAIMNMRQQLHSANPADTPAQVWALFVFQSWYKKYMS